MLSQVFEWPAENRAVVIWDVGGTLGAKEGSVLKNVGLVWIDISASFCARECCRVESVMTFCQSPTRELSGGTRPCRREETSQPYWNEWPSTMCSFELLSLTLCSRGPGHSPARRDCSSSPDTQVRVKCIVEKTKQKTPRKQTLGGGRFLLRALLNYSGDCVLLFF